MLKKTEIQLETLQDINMILMIETGIRGEISQCSHRYASANNKYMTDYDERKPSLYLAYFDMNNLYGNDFSQKLPFRNFKWVDPNDNVDTDKYRYIVDVNVNCKLVN